MGVAKALIAASATILIAGFAMAAPPEGSIGSCAPDCAPGQVKAAAPEIDATSGAEALALLSGMLLLVAERRRRRRK